jgi:transcriptional regulator with XRE-family HTH domain
MSDAVSRLSRWMQIRGASQAELAALLGVRQQTVSEWLTRRKLPGLRLAREIQRVTRIRAECWLEVERDRSLRTARGSQPAA